MATCCRHQPNGGLPANRPKFCKVIVDPEADKLRIPTEFTRRHGRDLPDHVFLKVPISGKLWEVELIKLDGEILFEKGWEKFKERYSVKFGHFLVFEYDGESQFNVSIFDMTCTEIEYPFDADYEEIGSESDDSVVFLGENCKIQKSKAKRVAVVHHQEENDEIIEHDYYTSHKTMRKRLKTEEFPTAKVKLDDDDDTENGEDEEEDAFTAQEVGGFTKQVMIHHAPRLEIPKEFAGGTGIRAHRTITLQNLKGGEWPINIVGRKYTLALGSGWNKFLIDNKIIVGSTLSFKLISSSTKYVIQARVIKTGPNKEKLFNDVRRRGSKYVIIAPHDHAKRMLVNVPRIVKSENDDQITEQENGFRVGSKWKFSQKMKKHHAYKLDLPKGFAKETGIAKRREIKLKDDRGREWPVHVATSKNSGSSLTSGWKDFLKANNVLEGNLVTISFKSITSSRNVIEARVLKNGDKGKPIHS